MDLIIGDAVFPQLTFQLTLRDKMLLAFIVTFHERAQLN